MKTTPIYLDRLDSALKKAGVSIKRSQLLETTAAAFGFHNSNEFTAAAARGDLAPPGATPIGSLTLPDGQIIVVITDAQAGRPYAIDKAFLEQNIANERGEKIGITPYGNLAYVHGIDFAALNALNAVSADSLLAAPGALPTDHVHVHRDILGSLIEASNSYAEDLSSGLEDGTYEDTANLDDVEIAIATARKILDSKSARFTQPSVKGAEQKLRLPLYSATVDHRHGTNAYSAFSDAQLNSELAEFCTEYWSEIAGRSGVPNTPDGMSDQEIVDTYFEVNDTEFLNRGMSLIDIPSFDVLLAIAHKNAGAAANDEPTYPQDADDSTEGRDRCSVCDCILTSWEVDVCRSHVGSKPEAQTLPGADYIQDVANTLSDGVVSDIWFDAHAYKGEEAAENTISETQEAMSEAARILRIVADQAAASPAASNPLAVSKADAWPNLSGPIWLTDMEARYIADPLLNAISFRGVGLDHTWTSSDSSAGTFVPLTDPEVEFVASRKVHQSSYQDGATIFYGPSVIYLSKKFHAPTLDCTSFGPAAKNADVQRNFDRIEKALKPALSNLGGHIIRSSGAEGFDEKLHILVPFAIAMSASSTADYFAAIDYLINASTDETSHKVTAQFVPQATIHDRIIEIDGMGAKDFDVTFEVLMLGSDQAMDIDNYDILDSFQYAHAAPVWIQTWPGPFEVKVDQDEVDKLFKICR